MAAPDFVTEAQLDSLTTNIATAVKANTTSIGTKTDDAVVDAHIADASGAHAASAISVLDVAGNFTGTKNVEAILAEIFGLLGGAGVEINDAATAPTSVWSSTKIVAELAAAVSSLVDAAPGTLDTLNELAAALGDDPNFAAAMAADLGLRLRFDAAQTLTAPQKAQALTNLGIVASAVDFAAAFNLAVA